MGHISDGAMALIHMEELLLVAHSGKALPKAYQDCYYFLGGENVCGM